MQDDRVDILVQAFSKTRRTEIDAAWTVAESMGDDLVVLLSKAFPQVTKAEGRASILRYVGRFSRESDVAFRMGIKALNDRAYAVRHYGCAILAYSLRHDALPILSPFLKHTDPRTSEDARAAVDAIKSNNHHFFKDRNHTGRILWEYATV
jgi:hypothetical protein